MKIHWSLSVAVTALLGGCASPGEQSQSFKSHFPVSDAPFVPSQIKGQQPVSCPGSGDADACVIPIKITGSSCDADNIDLEPFVDLGNFATKKRVVWMLPKGYQFCPRAGDGVFLKNPNVPDTLFEPRPTPNCSQTFEWKRKRSDSMDYGYLLRFRSAAQICGVKDPWMRN